LVVVCVPAGHESRTAMVTPVAVGRAAASVAHGTGRGANRLVVLAAGRAGAGGLPVVAGGVRGCAALVGGLWGVGRVSRE